MKFTERVTFRLIQMPCCGHALCWVNPRFPNFCPQCGNHIFTKVKQGVLLTDTEATLNYEGD
jgi:hypothetical protein